MDPDASRCGFGVVLSWARPQRSAALPEDSSTGGIDDTTRPGRHDDRTQPWKNTTTGHRWNRAFGSAAGSRPTNGTASLQAGATSPAAWGHSLADAVDMELSVKERGTPSQRTVLQAWIAGSERLVATSEEPDLDTALTRVRDELIRQLTDAKNRTEPRHRRSLRETIRDDE